MTATIKCENCGGIIYGTHWSTADVSCRCRIPASPSPTSKGWECPRCHKIHSPYKETCECRPSENKQYVCSDTIPVYPNTGVGTRNPWNPHNPPTSVIEVYPVKKADPDSR